MPHDDGYDIEILFPNNGNPAYTIKGPMQSESRSSPDWKNRTDVIKAAFSTLEQFSGLREHLDLTALRAEVADYGDYQVQFFQQDSDLSKAFDTATPGVSYGYIIEINNQTFDSGLVIFPTIEDAEIAALERITSIEAGVDNSVPLPDSATANRLGSSLDGNELRRRSQN
ncbi:MAG: hypothetical protein JJE13_11590 [Thermoleophilia bacterium]|nr:hypothetical protein [Thermoleophilia bacterium]